MDTTKQLLKEIVEMEYCFEHGYDNDNCAGYLSGLKNAYNTVTGKYPDAYFKKDGTFVAAFECGLTENYMEYIYGTYSIDDDGKIHVKFNN